MRQVFLSYGPLPNLRALLFYGFALEDNPHDTLALTFEARPSSGIAWWRNKQAWPCPRHHGDSHCVGGFSFSGRPALADSMRLSALSCAPLRVTPQLMLFCCFMQQSCSGEVGVVSRWICRCGGAHTVPHSTHSSESRGVSPGASKMGG